MKKLFYLCLCALLTTGVGCAISNYELMTDQDGNVVNTNGKAFVRQSSNTAVAWPDGQDHAEWYVDQNQNGDRVLTTYNEFNWGASQGTCPVGYICYGYVDSLYCTPERNGCAMLTAQDPEVGDVDIYDYSANFNCAGIRSLVYLTSTTRYYGECGRALPLTDRLSLLNSGRMISMNGTAALQWTMSPMNTTITLNNLAGVQQLIPMAGSTSVKMIPNATRTTVIDLSNPMNKTAMNAAADFMSNYGSRVNEVSIVFNGIEIKKRFAQIKETGNLRDLANRKY